MDEGKHKTGHGHAPGRRERRAKPRLSDVHRIVDTVLPKHMPDTTEESKHHERPEGERRSSHPPHKKK
jgi:hypothetical protein